MNPPDQPTLAPTPRTDEAYFANGATMYSLAGEMKLIERELAAAKAECERLKGALALGQQNCDDAYDDLREERDEAIARAEKAEAALAFIAENGGTKHETECGTISCNGLWCAEQARAAMKGTP
jgi:hypothetical protein